MTLSVKQMTDIPLKGKRVLIRADLNVPIKDGKVKSDRRIRAALPTIQFAINNGAQVILMSHLGRPEEGYFTEELSLAPVAKSLAELIKRPVSLKRSWLNGINENSNPVMCENVRFERGEKANDHELAKRMASLCDVYVMDAFGTAHRAHASTYGVAAYAPIACAGPLLVGEFEALGNVLDKPNRPVIAIVGGSKVSTKIHVLETLAGQADQLILGGGIANTFLAASGMPVARSLHEPSMLGFAERVLKGEFGNITIPLPTDVIVGESLDDSAKGSLKKISGVLGNDMILDIGPETSRNYCDRINDAKTILWNGPLGVFEHTEFASGTKSIAEAISVSEAFSIAGGGDTLAAIDQYGISKQISYISTGGGAFLEFLEGKKLPAVAILEERSREK
ncbi:MAG: phosphoglycerate kinase [Rhodospirillaceae bacterium]|nr:phosphoglycerate kinase [Rhodospirillaceae bacterium]